MDFKNVLFEKKNNFVVITVNRPDKLNALNADTLEDLRKAFSEVNTNDDVRCAVITGSGEKAFVAGADIKELNTLDTITGKEFAEKGQAVFNLIEELDTPVIAAVNGYALGGGCELALACHIRLASDNAVFGQPEVNLGIIPGYGGTQRFARHTNTGIALEYILTGKNIKSDDALRIGLINSIYKQDELLTKAEELAESISVKPAPAVMYALKAVRGVNQFPLKEGLELEASLFGLCCGTEDFKEGTSAFLEKRKPDFKHK